MNHLDADIAWLDGTIRLYEESIRQETELGRVGMNNPHAIKVLTAHLDRCRRIKKWLERLDRTLGD